MERSATTSFSILPLSSRRRLVDLHPGFLAGFVIGMQPARQVPQVLARVIEIDNLHRAGKMLVGKIPDPFGPVAHDDLLFRAAPAAVPGFQVDAFAELFGGFDGAGVGGGIRIADGVALLVPRGLGEHASQLDFPRVGRLAVGLAFPALRLFLHHRYSGPIHLHIQDGNRLADHHGQIQLDGSLDLPLLAGARCRSPIASAVRSTALVVTSRPASSFICWRP